MKCLFDHPMVYGVCRNCDDLPIRPGSELCKHYLIHGTCSYGPACMLHHPNIAPKDPSAHRGGHIPNGMHGRPGRGGMHGPPGRGELGGMRPHMHAPWNAPRGMEGGHGRGNEMRGQPHQGSPGRGGMMPGRGAAAAAGGYYGGPMHGAPGVGAPMVRPAANPMAVAHGAMPGAPGALGPGMMMPQQAGMPQQQFSAPAQMYRM